MFPFVAVKPNFCLYLQKLSCTRQTESKLSLHSFAKYLQLTKTNNNDYGPGKNKEKNIDGKIIRILRTLHSGGETIS